MTWNELAARIGKMPSEVRNNESVMYYEPYDDAEMFEVGVFIAAEDLSDPEGRVQIRKGECFLQ